MSRSSTRTETPARRSRPSISRAAATVSRCCSSLRQIGTITAWIGAIRGGRTSPSSSPWAITTAPISRVETPQEVFQTCSQPPLAVWNLHIEGAGEVLAQVVGGAGLQGPAVLHQGLDA